MDDEQEAFIVVAAIGFVIVVAISMLVLAFTGGLTAISPANNCPAATTEEK